MKVDDTAAAAAAVDDDNIVIKNENENNDDDDVDENDEKKRSSSSSSATDDIDNIDHNFSPTHMDDDEFQIWFYGQLIEETSSSPELVDRYNPLMLRISFCVMKWRIRYRGNKGLWKRIFKKQRVMKEIIESIPIISAVEQWVLAYDIIHDIHDIHDMGEEEVSSSSTTSSKTSTKDNHNNHNNNNNKKITIIDLCSGKGYLSMVLSELLPSEKVAKFWLVDKQWPLCHGKLQNHHISWEHIYGDTNSTDPQNTPDYYESWPIPLVTSKQDLKQNSMLRKFAVHLQKVTPTDGPILVLAVHLCGTLSIQAIKLIHEINNNNNNVDDNNNTNNNNNVDDNDVINENENEIKNNNNNNNVNNENNNENNNKNNNNKKKARVLILKPCCLPPMYHIKHTQCFEIGPSYKFDCKDVCARGKWNSSSSSSSNKNKNNNNTSTRSSSTTTTRWNGPPRNHLYNRFQKWCYHLREGTEASLLLQKEEVDVDVDVDDESEEKKGKEDYLNTNYNNINNNMEADSVIRRHGNINYCGGKVEIQDFPIQTKGGYQNSFIFAEITTTTTTTAAATTAVVGVRDQEEEEEEESKLINQQNEEVEGRGGGGFGVGSSSSSSSSNSGSRLTSQFWDDIHLLNDMMKRQTQQTNKQTNNFDATLITKQTIQYRVGGGDGN